MEKPPECQTGSKVEGQQPQLSHTSNRSTLQLLRVWNTRDVPVVLLAKCELP